MVNCSKSLRETSQIHLYVETKAPRVSKPTNTYKSTQRSSYQWSLRPLGVNTCVIRVMMASLLIFQPFNSLIYSFHFNLHFYKTHNAQSLLSSSALRNKWRSQPGTLINVLIQSSPGRNNASMGDKFPSVHFLCLSYGWCWAGDGLWGGNEDHTSHWDIPATLTWPCLCASVWVCSNNTIWPLIVQLWP